MDQQCLTDVHKPVGATPLTDRFTLAERDTSTAGKIATPAEDVQIVESGENPAPGSA